MHFDQNLAALRAWNICLAKRQAFSRSGPGEIGISHETSPLSATFLDVFQQINSLQPQSGQTTHAVRDMHTNTNSAQTGSVIPMLRLPLLPQPLTTARQNDKLSPYVVMKTA
jgi:hypothetical protein